MNLTYRRDDLQEALAKNLIIVSCAVAIICINGLIIMTYCNHSAFHNDARYILYVHLVINDMIMTCLSMTLFVLTYANPVFNVSVCCTLIIVAATTGHISPLNLAGMSIERYIAICKPLHHPHICTPRRTYILITLIWVVSFVPGIAKVVILSFTQPPSFFHSSVFCFHDKAFKSSHHSKMTQSVQGLYMSFVWFTIIYTYIRIFIVAKRAKGDSSARKARNTVLLHGVQLILCMLSYVSPVLMLILIPFFPSYRSQIAFCLYLITNILPMLLSSLIYGVRDQKFAKHMSMYFSCKVLIAMKHKNKLDPAVKSGWHRTKC